MSDTTGNEDVNTEATSNSTSTVNFNISNKKKGDERMKGDKARFPESSHFQGEFIPTCISPYQHNASAFTM